MGTIRRALLTSGLLILRVAVGVGIAYHGYEKLFNPDKMAEFMGFVEKLGLPMWHLMGWLSMLTEFFGGLFIAVGLGTRLASLFLVINMGVAAFVALAGAPFGKKELALAYFVTALVLVLTGPGPIALDKIIDKWLEHQKKKKE
jgi:putative oxidoreductase